MTSPPKDLLDEVEWVLSKMTISWRLAVNSSANRNLTLGEIGALAKYHLEIAALKSAGDTLARLRKAMEAKDGCSFSPDLMAGGTDCALCGRPWKDTPNG